MLRSTLIPTAVHGQTAHQMLRHLKAAKRPKSKAMLLPLVKVTPSQSAQTACQSGQQKTVPTAGQKVTTVRLVSRKRHSSHSGLLMYITLLIIRIFPQKTAQRFFTGQQPANLKRLMPLLLQIRARQVMTSAVGLTLTATQLPQQHLLTESSSIPTGFPRMLVIQ